MLLDNTALNGKDISPSMDVEANQFEVADDRRGLVAHPHLAIPTHFHHPEVITIDA